MEIHRIITKADSSVNPLENVFDRLPIEFLIKNPSMIVSQNCHGNDSNRHY